MSGRRHPHPDLLISAVSRPESDSHYVWRNAEMIKREYPGSVDELLPRLRKVYREKYRAEVERLRRRHGY